MKFKATISALVLLGCSLGYVQLASAQACGATQGSVQSGSFSGNNCGNNTNFSAICGNADTLGGGGMEVITFTLGAGYSNVTFSLTSVGSSFTPELAVIGSPCSSSTSCVIDNSAANASGTASGTLPTGLSAGSYFVFVADLADANCGAYNLSFTGTLPVKLESFSVN